MLLVVGITCPSYSIKINDVAIKVAMVIPESDSRNPYNPTIRDDTVTKEKSEKLQSSRLKQNLLDCRINDMK